MSDAELLTLYLGLFAHTDAGRHPGIYDVHGPSLQELTEGDDELSRAGNDLARRYEERGGPFATSFGAGHPHGGGGGMSRGNDSFLAATTTCCTIASRRAEIWPPNRGSVTSAVRAGSILLPHCRRASCCFQVPISIRPGPSYAQKWTCYYE